MTSFKAASRILATALSVVLLSAAPGLPAYAAAAEIIRLQAVAGPQGPRAIALPFSGAFAPLMMPALPAPAAGSSPLPGAAPSAAVLPALAAPAVLAPAAAPAPRVSAAIAATAAIPLSAARRDVANALKAAGHLETASPSDLRGLGAKLEIALTGAPALSAATDPAAPSAHFSDRGGHLARPAGDLIRQAVEAHDGPTAPAPPAGPSRTPPNPSQGPFWPKLLASGLALAPAYFLGLPLIAGGSAVLGGLAVAASLTLAVMPFLSESAPKALRALPGVALAGLGVAAAFSGLFVPAAFTLVGGWGLMRYGLGQSHISHFESGESVTAYFGGIAAVTVAALAAVHPAGLLAEGVRDAAYPVAALLWLHLPSWFGEGAALAVEGTWDSFKGLSRVMTALHRDTNQLERLQRFSERQWKQSKWNAVWLSLMWTPIILGEGAKWALAAAGGLYVGAVQAPVMFAWGASYKLFGRTKTTSYFAEAARFVFDHVQNGKASLFNKAEAKVLPLANSENVAARAAGSLALTFLQIGWLAYAAAAVPLLSVAGLMFAFGRMGTYVPERHDAATLRVNSEDSPGAIPQQPTAPEPTAPTKAPFAPKLIATALALAPAVYFGLPLFMGTLYHAVGILYALLVLPLAAMPFMGPKTPRFLKSLAGRGLEWNGLLLFFSGHAIILGLLASLGGWGFSRYVAARDGKDRGFDDASELGAFFGALGAAVAVGAAWTGLAGPWGLASLGLAAVTSPFLLMHLPEYVFAGVYGALKELPNSMRAFAAVLGFWHDDSKFLSNLRRHANYWLEKTYWNGVWLSVLWVPMGLMMAADYLLAIALGAAAGLVRAPFGFLAGATKNARPDGRSARFFSAALAGWRGAAEGSKPLFDRLISKLKPAMEPASAVSGRPTLGAALAFLGARFVQLAWLIGAIGMNVTGAAFLIGLYRGIKAALAPKAAKI